MTLESIDGFVRVVARRDAEMNGSGSGRLVGVAAHAHHHRQHLPRTNGDVRFGRVERQVAGAAHHQRGGEIVDVGVGHAAVGVAQDHVAGGHPGQGGGDHLVDQAALERLQRQTVRGLGYKFDRSKSI